MKSIILKTNDEFESLQNRIHLALQENIPGYNGERWANPIINVTTNELACVIDIYGLRGAVILGLVLTDLEKSEIVEISNDDENWFPRTLIGPPKEGV